MGDASPGTPLQSVLEVLCGRKDPPPSNFLSVKATGPLDQEEITALANTLRFSHFNGGLRLQGCSLGDTGAHALATALRSNTSLDSLELRGNDIGSTGARHLATALLMTPNALTTLDLSGNPCEAEAPEALRAIASALQRNRVASQGGPRQGGEENLVQLPSPMLQSTASPKAFCRIRLEDPASAGMRRSWQSGVDYEPMTPLNAALERAATGAAAAGLEYRLRRLEDSHEALGSDLDQIRELGRQLEAWKQQIEAASAQVATVLDLTQKDGTEIREQLELIEAWRVQVDGQATRFGQALTGAARQTQNLADDVQRIDGLVTVLQAEIGQQGRGVSDERRLLDGLASKVEECMSRLDKVAATQTADMRNVADLGRQVAALWADPSPNDSPRQGTSQSQDSTIAGALLQSFGMDSTRLAAVESELSALRAELWLVQKWKQQQVNALDGVADRLVALQLEVTPPWKGRRPRQPAHDGEGADMSPAEASWGTASSGDDRVSGEASLHQDDAVGGEGVAASEMCVGLNDRWRSGRQELLHDQLMEHQMMIERLQDEVRSLQKMILRGHHTQGIRAWRPSPQKSPARQLPPRREFSVSPRGQKLRQGSVFLTRVPHPASSFRTHGASPAHRRAMKASRSTLHARVAAASPIALGPTDDVPRGVWPSDTPKLPQAGRRQTRYLPPSSPTQCSPLKPRSLTRPGRSRTRVPPLHVEAAPSDGAPVSHTLQSHEAVSTAHESADMGSKNIGVGPAAGAIGGDVDHASPFQSAQAYPRASPLAISDNEDSPRGAARPDGPERKRLFDAEPGQHTALARARAAFASRGLATTSQDPPRLRTQDEQQNESNSAVCPGEPGVRCEGVADNGLQMPSPRQHRTHHDAPRGGTKGTRRAVTFDLGEVRAAAAYNDAKENAGVVSPITSPLPSHRPPLSPTSNRRRELEICGGFEDAAALGSPGREKGRSARVSESKQGEAAEVGRSGSVPTPPCQALTSEEEASVWLAQKSVRAGGEARRVLDVPWLRYSLRSDQHAPWRAGKGPSASNSTAVSQSVDGLDLGARSRSDMKPASNPNDVPGRRGKGMFLSHRVL